MNGKMRNANRIQIQNRDGKRSLGSPKRRWKDNAELNLQEIWYDGVGYIHLAHDVVKWLALVKTGSIKGGESLDQVINY
jgi:hypothetical protein